MSDPRDARWIQGRPGVEESMGARGPRIPEHQSRFGSAVRQARPNGTGVAGHASRHPAGDDVLHPKALRDEASWLLTVRGRQAGQPAAMGGGDPAIRFCGREIVSRTGCRAGRLPAVCQHASP